MEEDICELLNDLLPDEESELERVEEDISDISAQTQELALQNYRTFVKSATQSSDIVENTEILPDRLRHVADTLLEASGRCGEFGARATQLQRERSASSLSLQLHSQLIQLLELPQLMASCLQSGTLVDALAIHDHMAVMRRKHGHLALVASMADDIQAVYRQMHIQLLAKLKTSLQLPQYIEIIGYLRRMEVYSEMDLRLKFLQARDCWFQEQLSSISSDNAFHHISKTIEVSRMCLFDIVTQYRAVFSDDCQLLTCDAGETTSSVFDEWINIKVQRFIATLRWDLSRGAENRLDSVLSQVMYFGQSMARIGADLRPLLVQEFADVAAERFSQQMENAVAGFSRRLDLQGFGSCAELVTSVTTPTIKSSVPRPPQSLLLFPPLAVFCNGVLTALNQLRTCSPLQLLQPVRLQLVTAAQAVIDRLVQIHHTDSEGFSETERANFGLLCRCVCCDLVPFFDQCLRSLYPPNLVAEYLGISSLVVEKSNLCCLDVDSMTSVLRGFIAVESMGNIDEDPNPESEHVGNGPDVVEPNENTRDSGPVHPEDRVSDTTTARQAMEDSDPSSTDHPVLTGQSDEGINPSTLTADETTHQSAHTEQSDKVIDYSTLTEDRTTHQSAHTVQSDKLHNSSALIEDDKTHQSAHTVQSDKGINSSALTEDRTTHQSAHTIQSDKDVNSSALTEDEAVPCQVTDADKHRLSVSGGDVNPVNRMVSELPPHSSPDLESAVVVEQLPQKLIADEKCDDTQEKHEPDFITMN